MHYLLIPYATLVVLFISQFARRLDGSRRQLAVIIAAATAIMIFLAMAWRPVYGDSWRYYQYFLEIRSRGLGAALELRSADPLYVLLNWLVGQLGAAPWLLFGATLTIYFGVFVYALQSYVGKVAASALLISYSAFPYFITYGVNGLRQGLALSFLLLAYVQMRQGKKAAWVWVGIAPLWHSGAWLAVAVVAAHQLVFLPLIRRESRRWLVVFSLVALGMVLSASGLNEGVMGALPDIVRLSSSHELYFAGENYGYETGFRLDYFMLSLLPVGFAMFVSSRSRPFSYDGIGWWLSLYLCLNVIYSLFSFAPYSDRFGVFSWFLIPLILLLQVGETQRLSWIRTYLVVVGIFNILLLQFYSGSYIQLPNVGW